ncbi:hypothetical protein [Ferrovibrio sp.]|uniref:hypothetical protein n=1 Tax=Ferrovibrio sp. TaxID=1917215 RepID=UPI00311E9447
MNDGSYVIFTKLNPGMCLALDSSNNCVIKNFDNTSDATTWVVQSIAGSTQGFYLQHMATRNCIHFGNDGQVRTQLLPTVGAQASTALEYVVTTDDVGDGFCAINNHDHSYVLDVYRSGTNQGNSVVTFHWNKGDNQRWRFVPTGLL